MIASCSMEAIRRPSISTSTSTMARSPLGGASARRRRRGRRPSIRRWPAHDGGWRNARGSMAPARDRMRRRRSPVPATPGMHDALAAVDVEVVTGPLAVIGTPSIGEVDPPKSAAGRRASVVAIRLAHRPQRCPGPIVTVASACTVTASPSTTGVHTTRSCSKTGASNRTSPPPWRPNRGPRRRRSDA